MIECENCKLNKIVGFMRFNKWFCCSECYREYKKRYPFFYLNLLQNSKNNGVDK